MTGEGKALLIGLDEVKVLRKGGRGVILMGLESRDVFAQALAFGAEGVVVAGVGRGGKPLERAFGAGQLESWRGVRARKGRFLEPRIKDPRLSLPRADG
jgi:topoisomerase-4 subunit A